MAKIEPKILKGFRDFLPENEIPRQKMIETIKASFETFGFEPLETPALEYAETLVGKYGDEGDKLMYRFKDNGERDVALRYDLTIPLARVVAQNGDMKRPWKRYQISPVWRADNPQKGRYREFYQCDADIVGSTSPLADAEILALAATTLKKLGVSNFIIRVNSRKVISAFFDSLGITSEKNRISIIRSIDKISKIGKDGVKDELDKLGVLVNKIQLSTIRSAATTETKLSDREIEKIISFSSISLDAQNNRNELGQFAEQFPKIREPLLELLNIVDTATELTSNTARFIVDFSIARGLDYYTGMIFETVLADLPNFGSVLSGGRYDNLIGMFSNKPVPAVGGSIGLDRLFAALEELKLVKKEKSVAKALVINFDESLQGDYLELASNLRDAGVNTILYFETADLKKQLSYASDKGIRYALIYGSNEAKEGKVVIKDLEKGSQKEVLWKDAAAALA